MYAHHTSGGAPRARSDNIFPRHSYGRVSPAVSLIFSAILPPARPRLTRGEKVETRPRRFFSVPPESHFDRAGFARYVTSRNLQCGV